MSELPSRPTARILRADDAALWSDGFAFLQAAKEQAEQVKALFTEAGFEQVSVIQDLGARDRVVTGVLPA